MVLHGSEGISMNRRASMDGSVLMNTFIQIIYFKQNIGPKFYSKAKLTLIFQYWKSQQWDTKWRSN